MSSPDNAWQPRCWSISCKSWSYPAAGLFVKRGSEAILLGMVAGAIPALWIPWPVEQGCLRQEHGSRSYAKGAVSRLWLSSTLPASGTVPDTKIGIISSLETRVQVRGTTRPGWWNRPTSIEPVSRSASPHVKRRWCPLLSRYIIVIRNGQDDRSRTAPFYTPCSS